ncbi:unnamed protein product [Mytilus coruscus]|uniref:Ig-like domain-containing protein n=1 Tax=Mytilus coruscus TaxID=42192 RepID=A0A6J8CL46_MYTCO|nr:unnamed protein product [Mytilus coruscus]
MTVELRSLRRILIRQRLKRGLPKKLKQQKGFPIKTAIMIDQSLMKLEDELVLAIGDNITLSCDTPERKAIKKTFPKSKHQWIFNNVNLEIDKKRMKLQGLFFEISYFNATDQGLYACRIHYAPKRRKTIYFATLISEKVGIPVKVMETKTLKLHCPSSPIGRLFRKSYRNWSLKGKVVQGYTSIPAKRRAFESFYNASSLKHEGSWVCQVTDPATDRQWDLIRYDVSVTALPLHESKAHKFVMDHPILIATQSLSVLLFLVAMFIYFVHEPKQTEKPGKDEELDENYSDLGSANEGDGNDNAEEKYGDNASLYEEEGKGMNFGEQNLISYYSDEDFGDRTPFHEETYGDNTPLYEEEGKGMNFEPDFISYYSDEYFGDRTPGPFHEERYGDITSVYEEEDGEWNFGEHISFNNYYEDEDFGDGTTFYDENNDIRIEEMWKEGNKEENYVESAEIYSKKRFRSCNSGVQQVVELQTHNQLNGSSQTENHSARNRIKRFKIKDKLSKIHADIPLPKNLRKLIKKELKNATHVRYNRTVGGTMEITCENEISRQINKLYKKSKAKWLHNNGALRIIAGRMFYQFGILRIERLEPEDQGTYICQVEYEPEEFKTVALYTLVTDPGIQVRVKESLNFNLHCPSQSLYHMVKHSNRSWIHNHNVTNYSTSIFNKSSANFYNANKDMAGNWTCVVFDPIKNVEFDLVTYQVHVDPPPSLFEILYQYFKDNPTICGAIGLPLLCIFLVFLVTVFYFVDKHKEENKKKLDMFKSKLKDLDLKALGDEAKPYYDEPDASPKPYQYDRNIVWDYPYRNQDHENSIARLYMEYQTHYRDDYMRHLQNLDVNGSPISYHNSIAGSNMKTLSQYRDDYLRRLQNPDANASPKSYHDNFIAGLKMKTLSQYRNDYMRRLQNPDCGSNPKSYHENFIAGSNMRTLSQYRNDYMRRLQNPDFDSNPISYHENFIAGSNMRTLSQYQNDYMRRLQNPDVDASPKSYHENFIAGSNMRTLSQYQNDYMRRLQNPDVDTSPKSYHENFIAGSNMRTLSQFRNDYMRRLQNPDFDASPKSYHENFKAGST